MGYALVSGLQLVGVIAARGTRTINYGSSLGHAVNRLIVVMWRDLTFAGGPLAIRVVDGVLAVAVIGLALAGSVASLRLRSIPGRLAFSAVPLTGFAAWILTSLTS